jgi:hypothetical protein
MSKRGRRSIGLRAALEKKQTRRTYYDIPLVDSELAQQRATTVQEAKNTKMAAEYLLVRTQDEERHAEVKAAVEQAQREVDAAEAELANSFYRLWFRSLPESDFEALVAAHPPSEEQQQKAKEEDDPAPSWDDETFPFALLAACCEEEDLSAEEWREELARDRWSRADKREIISRVYDANMRSFNEALSFG